MKNLTLRLFVVLMFAAMLAGSLAAPAAAAGTITIAQGVDVSTLDPHMSNDTPTTNVMFNMFDALLRRDVEMNLLPALAESYTQIDDLNWSITLRQGVTFHNGEPFDAAAVKFSYERVLNPDYRSPQASGIRFVESVDIVDDYTVQITTSQPYPLLPNQMSAIAILPPQYYAEVGTDGFRQHPVGTGAYVFQEWRRDERLVVEANPDYFLGTPAIERAVFRPIPETATRMAELQSGAVDLIVNVPPHQVRVLENAPDLAAATAPSARILFIVLTTIEEGPLQDVRVRQALNYAVDQQAIVDAILEGYGIPLAAPAPQASFGFYPDLEGYGYDPDRARELLADAGYPDGFEVVFEAPSGRYLMDREVGQAVNGFLEAVGIQTDFSILEWGVFVGKLYEKAGATMMLLGLGSSLMDVDSYLYGQLRTGQISSYYSDEELDALLDASRTEMDVEKRIELLYEIQRLSHEQAALIPLYQQVDIYGIRDRVAFTARPDERLLVFEMELK